MDSIFKKFTLVLLLVLVSGGGQILLKYGAANMDLNDFPWSVITNFWITAGVFLLGVGFLIYLLLLSKSQLNTIYPILVAGSITFIAIVSAVFLREALSLWQIIGILLIILGVLAISFEET